jgi:two-component system NtrC family sensor kinase
MANKRDPKNLRAFDPDQLRSLFLSTEKNQGAAPEMLMEIYRSLIESAGDSIYLVDESCRYIFMNRTHLERIGLTLEEVIGRGYGDFHARKQEDKFRAAVRKVFATGEPIQDEHRNDRYGRYFLKTLSPMRNPSGDIIGVTVVSKDITDAKRAEQALDIEREKFETLVKYAPVGLVLASTEGVFKYVNPRFTGIFGYDLGDLPTVREWFRKAYPDVKYRREVIGGWMAYLKSHAPGEQLPGTYSITCKDGTQKIARFAVVRIESGDMLTVCEDVTESARVQQALLESEEKYRGIIEGMEEGYHEVDLAGRFTFVNDSMQVITGYSRKELIGMSYRRYAADEQHAGKVFRAYNEIFLSGKHLEWFEWDIRRKDGSMRTIEVTASLIRDRSGQPRGFRGIVRDTTDRKKAEEALRIAEEFYRTVANNSLTAIYIVQDSKIRFVNPYLPSYSGYSENDLMGMDILDFVVPEDRERVREQAIRMLRGESRVPYEYRIIDKSGQTRWLVETVSSINYKGKRATLGTTMDITERKKMEQQLQDARDLLLRSEKLAAVGQLSAGVVHEILNPVNIISLRLQLLESTESLSDKTMQTLKICRAQIERVMKISRDLSQFSRITAKHVAPGDLHQLIEQVLTLTAPKMRLERIAVEKAYADALPLIPMDRFRIEQVILNLIINALDAVSGKEKKLLRIATALEKSDGRTFARIAFADNGTGIKPEDMHRLFDPFFTTKEAGKGTGLGLSICYGIIQEHGGNIRVENNDLGGATFIIELPVEG